jgi:hypothetical protein
MSWTAPSVLVCVVDRSVGPKHARRPIRQRGNACQSVAESKTDSAGGRQTSFIHVLANVSTVADVEKARGSSQL